jgi:CRP/FNR family transcriptional regulator
MDKLKFLLESVPFFSELTPNDLEPLLPLFLMRKYKRGSSIFFEGEEGNEFFIIQSGMIKIFRFDSYREITLALCREGDYFGEMAILQAGQTRSASAEALEATQVFVLKRRDFEKLLRENSELTLKLLDISMNRLRRANEKIQDLAFLDVRSRIFKTVIDLTNEHGVTRKNDTLINVSLTHKQIADLTGCVRETVTKVLLELQNENIINIEKKKIAVKNINRIKQKISVFV